MILPVENKLETPEDFLDNFGVLPTTMLLCTGEWKLYMAEKRISVFMIALGFYGYTAFGDRTEPTITTNVPLTG